MSFDLEKDAEVMLNLVASMGERLQGRPETVTTKQSHRDVVTELDELIETEALSWLKRTAHPVVTEESVSTHQAFHADRPCWFLDPIDGSTNFVAQVPMYGVSLGLMHDQTPLLGAVALPALNEIYFTHAQLGAYCNGRKLKIQDATLQTALLAASFSGVKGEPAFRRRQYEWFGELNDASRGCLRTGSAAVNLCFVASGRLQAAYGFAAKLWDVAGGLAVARQAGAAVRLKLNREALSVDYVVGAPSVVEAVTQVFARQGVVL